MDESLPMRDWRCPSCKYDLTGLDVPRCPECGQRFRTLEPIAPLGWRMRTALRVLEYAAIIYIAKLVFPPLFECLVLTSFPQLMPGAWYSFIYAWSSLFIIGGSLMAIVVLAKGAPGSRRSLAFWLLFNIFLLWTALLLLSLINDLHARLTGELWFVSTLLGNNARYVVHKVLPLICLLASWFVARRVNAAHGQTLVSIRRLAVLLLLGLFALGLRFLPSNLTEPIMRETFMFFDRILPQWSQGCVGDAFQIVTWLPMICWLSLGAMTLHRARVRR